MGLAGEGRGGCDCCHGDVGSIGGGGGGAEDGPATKLEVPAICGRRVVRREVCESYCVLVTSQLEPQKRGTHSSSTPGRVQPILTPDLFKSTSFVSLLKRLVSRSSEIVYQREVARDETGSDSHIVPI